MKNPPTLADACIMTAHDKKLINGNIRAQMHRRVYLDIATARKFVLDADMSRFVAELQHSFWTGGLRKRVRMLDNARLQARLPHHRTWIELDYHAYIKRIQELGGQGVSNRSGPDPKQVGWFIRQHPGIETSFIANEIRGTVTVKDRAFLHLLAAAWSSSDQPTGYRRFPDATTETSEAVVAMEGYHSMLAHWTGGDVDDEMMTEWLMMAADQSTDEADAVKMLPVIALRAVWAFLATINDLPVKIVDVEPSRGFLARGNYKKFLKHSVVHLTVPETQWRKVISKAAALVRRRAHQVRGHWRVDYHNPLTPVCEHEFNAEMICTRCRGRKLWIAEHQRGDSSIGFVTHDYEVHRER